MNRLQYKAIALATISVLMVSTVPSAMAFGDFAVQNDNVFYGFDDKKRRNTLVVVGELVNQGKLKENAEVSLTLYNAAGDIIGVAKTYDDNVPPGERVPFKFIVNGLTTEGGIGNIATYRLQAQ